MIRRIAGTFLALLAALLVLAVVPLGVSMASNQRTSFRFDTDSAARAVAADAEEHLADRHTAEQMLEGLDTTAARGDCSAVFDVNANQLASTPCTVAADSDALRLLYRVIDGDRGPDPDEDLTAQDGSWLLVSVPVGDDGRLDGVVIYARNTDSVNDSIAGMWGWLAATGIGCLVLAALLSVRLARWVSRPLGTLGLAAGRLGEGDLGVRAATDRGPEQVRRLAETFNWMAERIETLVHAHRSWIADVSHQLRTPLTALRLRLDLLSADIPDEHAAAEMAGAQEEIARLSRMVDGLLAVARAESALPTRMPVRADLVAEERVAAWEPVADERGVALTVHAPEPVSIPLGDGDLEQILDNLVANALEAVGEHGNVRIEVMSHGARAYVRVVDDGPGMSDELQAAAFHRYGHPEPRGHGLGLAIVQRLAAANGGLARLSDTDGGGLTVELEWAAAVGAVPPVPGA